MSRTEIYGFNKDGKAREIGGVQNAFRGAMAVWNILDKKYLPLFEPEWAMVGGEYLRAADKVAIKEIWGLFKDEKVSIVDRIVLGSTFDKVIVEKENLPELLKAFREFEGETSLKEQADIIEKNMDRVIAVGWNQTSVNCDTWSNFGGFDEEIDESIPYNILTMDEHWELFSRMKEL